MHYSTDTADSHPVAGAATVGGPLSLTPQSAPRGGSVRIPADAATPDELLGVLGAADPSEVNAFSFWKA